MSKKKLGGGIAVDSVWLTVVKLMTSFISIFTTKILAVEFSLADYGTYSQGLLIETTAISLSILGLADGVNFFYNGCKDERQKIKNVNTTFFIQTVVGVLCAAIIAGGNGLITDYFGNPALTGIYVYIIFVPLLTNYLSMYQVLFVSVGKAKAIAIRNLFVSLFKLTSVAIAAGLTQNIKTVFAFTLIADVAQVVYFAVVFGKRNFFVNPFNIDKKKIKEIFFYCLPLAVYVLTNTLSRDIAKYVISYFTDTETLAVYTNAAKPLPIDMLSVSFATVILPNITKYVVNGENKKCRELFKNYLEFSYITTWIIASGAIVCSRELMLILYDEKYLSGLSVFIVYILSDMMRFANVSIILRAKGKTKEIMLYSGAMLAINFILNILLFKIFGVLGPALATLIVTLVMNLAMLIHGSRIINGKISDFFDFKNLVVFVVELLFGGFIVYVIRHFCNQAGLNYILTFGISYACYVIVLGTLNFKKIIGLFKRMNAIKVGE